MERKDMAKEAFRKLGNANESLDDARRIFKKVGDNEGENQADRIIEKINEAQKRLNKVME